MRLEAASDAEAQQSTAGAAARLGPGRSGPMLKDGRVLLQLPIMISGRSKAILSAGARKGQTANQTAAVGR
jgi:hypothetical protein